MPRRAPLGRGSRAFRAPRRSPLTWRASLLLALAAAALARAEAPDRASLLRRSRADSAAIAAQLPARQLLASAPAAAPSCGDGVLESGESCEPTLGAWAAAGCDAQRCAAKPGWRCDGEVGCDCANAPGTLALPAGGCAPQRCPYAARCPGGGAGCATGAEGAGCALCSRGFARSRLQLCRACPHGVPWMLLAAFAGLLLGLLVIGPFLARLASPVVAAQLRILILYLQHLALVADARLAWPPAAAAAFAPLRGLTRGADVASPECFFPGKWSVQRHIELLAAAAGALAAAVAVLLGGYTLLQRRIALRDDDSEAEHAIKVAAVEAFGRRRNALRQFYAIYAQIAYVMLVSVLLDAWDCPPDGAGGARVLRADPATACEAVPLRRFRLAATAALALFAVAVPLGIAALLASLRRKALRASALLRPAWRGLAYPATRAAWGGFYVMYRFDGWHELRESDADDAGGSGVVFAVASPVTPGGVAVEGGGLLEGAASPQQFRGSPGSARDSVPGSPGSPGSPASSAGDAAWPGHHAKRSRGCASALRRALRRASRVAAPYFECVYYAQRLLLLAAGHAFPTATAAAAGQATVFAAGAALVGALAPLQRLDVRLPLRFWVPMRLGRAPAIITADASASASAATSPWRRGPCGLGWSYASHVMVFDALNATAVAANVVPMLTIVAAVAAKGPAAPALGFFVLGLNALMLLATVAIWLGGVAAFREQAAELAALRAACCAAARAGRGAATATAEVVVLADSDAAACDELPLAPAAAPLRRRARRSSAASADGIAEFADAPAEAAPCHVIDAADTPISDAIADAGCAATSSGAPASLSRTLRVSIPEWLAELEASPAAASLSPHSAGRGLPARLSVALGLPTPRARRSSAAHAVLGPRLPRGAALLGVAAAAARGDHDDDEEAAACGAAASGSPRIGADSALEDDDCGDDEVVPPAGGPLSRLRAWVAAPSAAALAGVHAGADTEATLVAAGAMFALMRARQQHTRALALARAAEFVTALALVRLHHRRSAAQRAGAAGGARLAAIEAEMVALERAFAEHGFEAAMARRGAERAERQHRQGDAPGIAARAALAAALLILAALVAALGALARRVLPRADVVAVDGG